MITKCLGEDDSGLSNDHSPLSSSVTRNTSRKYREYAKSLSMLHGYVVEKGHFVWVAEIESVYYATCVVPECLHDAL